MASATRRMSTAAISLEPTRGVWATWRVLAHHLVRCGYGFGSCYPGSPIVPIAEELVRLDAQGLLRFRYATNEKIAFEMAAAGALAGGRAFAVMKHVGANVALDSVMALAYTGQRGALLLIVGDDPSCESSSTEQDSRLMAKFLGVPCVEPSSVGDLCAAVELATELSTTLGSVVIFRLTTDVCLSSGILRYEPVETPPPPIALDPPRRDRRFVVVPANTRRNRLAALERLEKAKEFTRDARCWNEEPGDGGCDVGFIVQNAIHPSFMKAAERLGIAPAVFRTQVPYPVPEDALRRFVSARRRVAVVEELDPVLEEQTIAIVHRHRLNVDVRGSEIWPRFFQLDEERLLEGLAKLLERPLPARRREPLPNVDLPGRGPTFCAGCPHTASFHALRLALELVPERPFLSSDIGCYTLGAKAGIELGDVALAMGSSLGIGVGAALQGIKTLAMIGDSTFLHAGLPALQNAVEQKVDLPVCVFDNGVAAMTGGQATTAEASSDRLYAAALGLGAASVVVVDPFEVPVTRDALVRAMTSPGVNVVILRSPCALTIRPKPRRPVVDLARCNGCGDCVTKIHCPAIGLSAAGKFTVDTAECVGCGLCSKVCPEGALTPQPFPPS
jgi:indolepyruvate ferredoxin oxidoreductase, alpha subunit